MALFSNNDATGTLMRAFASRAAVAANSGRTEGTVGNSDSNARLFVSFGTDHGTGAGCHIVKPGDELDFSASPGRLTGAVFIYGSSSGQSFTFEETATSQSAITITP